MSSKLTVVWIDGTSGCLWPSSIVSRFVERIPLGFLVIFLIIFTICFVIDIVNTVIVLLRRKKVFLKLKEDIDELRAQFESDRDILNEEFERWIK